jgi:uncharacterized protein
MSDLTVFRKEKDDFYQYDPQSPLTPEQKRTFKGLAYFPENPALRLEVNLQRFPKQETIQMLTSTGDQQTYSRYGRIEFSVDGIQVGLTIYKDESIFFLPFVDALAGKETYGAGRYLEPEPLENDRLIIDFNLAYNPYCAYNDLWSCPITPAENRLKVPIRAGEKNFHA